MPSKILCLRIIQLALPLFVQSSQVLFEYLAFLTGRRVNLRHQILIPDFMSTEDELDAIAALERDRVRFVFILNRAMSEFGATSFGRDFNQTLGSWIEENFDVVEVFGGSPDEEPVIGEGPFFVKVYERRGASG